MTNSVLQIRTQDGLINVPVSRGKSAYEHALNGGLQIFSEEVFNNMLANLVIVDNAIGDSRILKINFSASEPDENTDDNTITIVLR